MAATPSAIQARRRAAARRRFRVRMAWLGVLVLLAVLGVGLLYAGSPKTLAAGTSVDGVDVGGLSRADARAVLEHRWRLAARKPVEFVSGMHRFSLTAAQLGVHVDWAKAVEEASTHGDGFGFVRGYRRLGLRLFPVEVDPTAQGSPAAVAYEVDTMANAIDRPHHDAQLVRRGLNFTVAPGQTGRVLDRDAAAQLIVASLASLDRAPV